MYPSMHSHTSHIPHLFARSPAVPKTMLTFFKVEIANPAEVSHPLADFLDAKLSLYEAQSSSGKLGTPSFKATYALSHRSLHKSPLFASKVPPSVTFQTLHFKFRLESSLTHLLLFLDT